METKYRGPHYFWDKNVKILCREIGEVHWREGETIPARQHHRRIEQLKDENPSMEFTWTIAD